MSILDWLFKPKQKTVPQPQNSEVYTKVVHLLVNDFSNWKAGILNTFIHQPTGVALAITGKSAFVYFNCNNFNGRSGKYVLLGNTEENSKLYDILSVLVDLDRKEQQKINEKELLQVINTYQGDEK